MAQTSGNNWIYWTLGSVAVATLGVGAFLYFRQKNKSGKKSGGGSSDVITTSESKPKQDSNVQQQTQVETQTQPTEVPTNFNTKEQGNAFRRWVRAKDLDFAKEIDLDASGSFDNSNIRKAYAKYGNDWQETNKQVLNSRFGFQNPFVKDEEGWQKVSDGFGVVEQFYQSGDSNNGARISFDRNGRVYIQGRKNGGLGSKWKAGGWFKRGNLDDSPILVLINGKEYSPYSTKLSDMKKDLVWQIWKDGRLWSGSAFTPFSEFANMIDGASSNDFQDETL